METANESYREERQAHQPQAQYNARSSASLVVLTCPLRHELSVTGKKEPNYIAQGAHTPLCDFTLSLGVQPMMSLWRMRPCETSCSPSAVNG